MKTDSCCSPPAPLPRSLVFSLSRVFRSQGRSWSRKANQDHFTGMFVEESFPDRTPLTISGACGGGFFHTSWYLLCAAASIFRRDKDPRLAANNVGVFLSGNGMCVSVMCLKVHPRIHDCSGQRSNVITEGFPLLDSFPLLPVSLCLVDRK